MAIANFEQLHRGLLELSGLDAPHPEAPYGSHAFSFRLNGVLVSLMEFETTGQETAYVLTEIGPVPPEQALARGLSMLAANSLLLGPYAPKFSLNPFTGEAILQWACPLKLLTVRQVHQGVTEMVALALRLQSPAHYNDRPELRAVSMPTEGPRSISDATCRFHRLCRSLAAIAGLPEPALPLVEEPCYVKLNVNGADFVMCHLPLHMPDFAMISMRLSTTENQSNLEHVNAMLGTNFSLMTEPHGATFCHDPASGEFFIQYAYGLAEIDGRHCLAQMRIMAAVAAEWKPGGIRSLAQRLESSLAFPPVEPGVTLA